VGVNRCLSTDCGGVLAGAPGRIRTRDLLLRRSSAALVRPAGCQVSGHVGISMSDRDSPPFPLDRARNGHDRAPALSCQDGARAWAQLPDHPARQGNGIRTRDPAA
jgi:hypothetical protein